MSNPVISWASNNPMAAGAAALGVVVVIMMLSGGGSSEGDSGDNGLGSAGVAAYYAAVSNQAQAGAAIQVEQIKANASTNNVLIAASYGLENSKIWAPVSQAANNNAADIAKSQQKLDYDYAMYALASNERIVADAHKVDLAKAQLQQTVDIKAATAGKPSKFAQGVGAVSGLVSSVGKVLPFL